MPSRRRGVRAFGARGAAPQRHVGRDAQCVVASARRAGVGRRGRHGVGHEALRRRVERRRRRRVVARQARPRRPCEPRGHPRRHLKRWELTAKPRTRAPPEDVAAAGRVATDVAAGPRPGPPRPREGVTRRGHALVAGARRIIGAVAAAGPAYAAAAASRSVSPRSSTPRASGRTGTSPPSSGRRAARARPRPRPSRAAPSTAPFGAGDVAGGVDARSDPRARLGGLFAAAATNRVRGAGASRRRSRRRRRGRRRDARRRRTRHAPRVPAGPEKSDDRGRARRRGGRARRRRDRRGVFGRCSATRRRRVGRGGDRR